MTFRGAWPALALLLAVASVPESLGAAPSTADVEAARSAFERGAGLASEQRWSDALAEFEASAKLLPHATTTYNIGYCLRALGRPTRAKKHFLEALARDDATAGKELTPQLRAAAQKYVGEAKAKIATPWLAIAPVDAKITVDGAPLEAAGVGHYLAGTRPPGPGETVATPAGFVVELDAGPHEIVVVAPDGRSQVVHVQLAAGSTESVRVEVAPKGVAVEHGSRRTAAFVVGGLAVSVLALGTFAGLHARSLWNDALAVCPRRTTCPDDRGAELSLDARRWANVSTISFVVGGAALLGGSILFLTSSAGPRAQVSAALDPTGAFVSVAGRF